MKSVLSDFISQYGTTILYAVLTAIAGWLGIEIKKHYTRWVNTREKKEVVSTVVKAVEQLYWQLGGDEKLVKATEAASQMLAERGINITELELRYLIESSVAEFKHSFNKDDVAADAEVEVKELSEGKSEANS